MPRKVAAPMTISDATSMSKQVVNTPVVLLLSFATKNDTMMRMLEGIRTINPGVSHDHVVAHERFGVPRCRVHRLKKMVQGMTY